MNKYGCEHDDIPMDRGEKRRRKMLFDIAIHGEGMVRTKTLKLLSNTYGLTKIFHDGKMIVLEEEIKKADKERADETNR